MKKFFLLGTAFFILTGCSTNVINNVSTTPTSGEDNQSCGLTPTQNCSPSLQPAIDTVLIALKTENFQLLGEIASKEGIRFSPYTYVNTGNDIILTKNDILNDTGEKEYTRGAQDGSGMPITGTLKDYFKHFVYDGDFAEGEKFINQKFTRGNSINNMFDVYSGKQIVEYYLSGTDPKYDGMDRKSLTLILSQEDNAWKLIGIVHNQWTI